MASINFPSGLNKPLQNSFSRIVDEGFSLNDISSGQPFNVVESDDLTTTYNIEFIFSQYESRVFAAWLRKYSETLNGEYFNISVYTENGFKSKVVRFIEGGTPQLTQVQSTYNIYRATIETRETLFRDPISPVVIVQGGIASV